MQPAHALGHTVALGACLSDPSRVRALLVLRDRELCVCQLVELLGLSTSTVSRHLVQLHRAGLVAVRRTGKWTWYRRTSTAEEPGAHALLTWLDTTMGESSLAITDRRSIEEIVCRVPGPCVD